MRRLPEEISLQTDAAGSPHPDAFGPFRVLHQIGAGALGPVFRAFHPDTDRLVAIKVFALDLPPDAVHRLVAEFERLVAADLTHPVIVAPRATGVEGVNAYLALEYVGAGSLDVVVRGHGPAPTAAALRTAAELAGALDFAAVVNVHHGTLHPRDVLLSQEEIRLTGLGVARALERVGIAPPVRRPYTAPERAASLSGWDGRADIYSLAALMYEMLWGRRLVGTGADVADTLTEVSGGDLAALRAVFTRALADDPKARFATALDFAEALTAAFSLAGARTTAVGQRTAVAARQQTPAFDERAFVAGSQLHLLRDDEPVVNHGGAMEDLPLVADSPRTDGESVPLTGDVELAPHDLQSPAGDYELSPDEDLRPAVVETVLMSDDVLQPAPIEGRQLIHEDVRADSADSRPTADSRVVVPDDFRLSPEEPHRSNMRMLALAATVFLAVGFGAGYLVAIRDRGLAPLATATAPATAAPAPEGRDFTEKTVDAQPRSAVPAPVGDRTSSSLTAAPPPTAPQQKERAQSAAARSAPVAGRVLVRSSPSGARVFVNGRDRGVTPATISNLPRGTHRVRLVREGYTSIERRVVVSEAEPAASLSVDLVPARDARATVRTPPAATTGRYVGALTVDSRPAGALVYLDGKELGTTPLQIGELPVGEHAIRIEREGYRRWSSSVRIVANERSRVAASLER